MNQLEDLEELARTIIDSNMYMVLGTADESGQPWVSPVYYASAGYKEFLLCLVSGGQALAKYRRASTSKYRDV